MRVAPVGKPWGALMSGQSDGDRLAEAVRKFLTSETARFGRSEIDSVSDELAEQDLAALADALAIWEASR